MNTDTTAEPRAAVTEHRPGQWPAGCHRPGRDEAWVRLQAERARRELVLASIAADLGEQPSPRAVRVAGRRWCLYVTQLADDIATDKQQGGDQ
ncbi:hypothetical protein [Kitasatospora sp. GP82]|uniref:hypothetical protein n=1 Tax=Kitasatospora sp. GP82 TaxID=3035089 RepID=UPI0024741768|nr:hypothetical protein [Kitasatospora sp. GP82]MDH6125922.1 hypothetical protein [Kitasatospora sp. GP82]